MHRPDQRYATYLDDPRRLVMSHAEALARVHAYLGEPLEEGPLHESLEAATWWYLPITWIGCSGFMLDKRDGAVHQLGSSEPIELCFWAQEHDLLRDPCDLVVDTVHDHARTIATLAAVVRAPSAQHFPMQWAGADRVAEALERLPSRFPRQRFWFQLATLRAALDDGAFACHAEPASALTLPELHVVLDVTSWRALVLDEALFQLVETAAVARRLEIDTSRKLHTLVLGAVEELGVELSRQEHKQVRRRHDRVPRRMVEAATRPSTATSETEAIAEVLAAGGASWVVGAGPPGGARLELADFLARLRRA